MSITFLVGPRGCGKTLTARLLEDLYGCRVCDIDVLIRDATGKTVAEIVTEGGWPAFRAVETAALAKAVAEMTGLADGKACAVIATGGGIILSPENRARMRREGTVVYLAVPVEALVARLAPLDNDTSRPPLTGLPLAEEIAKVLDERDPLYREAAHHVLDASRPPEEVARNLYETIITPAQRDKDSL